MNVARVRRPHGGQRREGGLLRRALAHRDLRLLLVYVVLSQAGHLMYVVAVSVFVFERTGSPAWVSAVVITRGIPVALLSPVGGLVADRFEHRRLLTMCTVLDGAVLASIAVVMVLSGPAWAIVPLVAASSVIGTPLTPALMAYLPVLVPETDLVAANTAREAARKLAQLGGPVTAGVIISTTSTGLAVLASLVLVLASALSLVALRTRSGTTLRSGRRATGMVRALAGGVAALRESSGAVVLLWLFAAYHFVLGFEHVLYTVTADQVLGLGADGLGYLFAAVGLGGVLVAARTSALAGKGDLGRLLAGSVAAIGAPFVVLGWVRNPAVALLLLALVGAAAILFHVLAMTTLQRVLARSVLGRVTGLRSSVTYGAMLLGSLVAPVLVAWIGLRFTFLFCGLLLVGAGVVALPRLTAIGAAAERRRLELAPLVALLERLPLFEGAPPATLEALAQDLVREQVPAGRDVVRQGEAAEDLYVIESGRFAVVAAAGAGELRAVAELGSGDYFGEIGLIRGIPRIATVQATEDGVVHRLSGERFLAEVVDRGELSAGVRESIDDRMSQTALLHETREPPPSEEPG